jgi:hypothetical protein
LEAFHLILIDMDTEIDGVLGLNVLCEGDNPTVEYGFDPKASQAPVISILILLAAS